MIAGVPQGPLLINIFLNDIFLFLSKCQLCNYVDDNTLYKSVKNKQQIKNDLEMHFMILHKWFNENHMVLKPGKCHYIAIGDNDPSRKIILNNNEIANSNEQKLLGILSGSKLTEFSDSILSFWKKAGQKPLIQRSEFIAIKLSIKILIQFLPTDLDVYFSILNALNSIHERSLRLIYNDYELPFDRVL